MQIGATIRKYRLEKNMTQEEVATRLGVTAPAVNKWERGNSMPDITLLSPIARLLDISLDTLLSHTDSLSEKEANKLILIAHDRLVSEPFEAVLDWVKEQLQTYPNSAFLALYMARVLSSHIQIHHPELENAHTPFFLDYISVRWKARTRASRVLPSMRFIIITWATANLKKQRSTSAISPKKTQNANASKLRSIGRQGGEKRF